MTAQDQEEKLHELIESFEHAMLVTRTAQGELRSRPMRVVAKHGSGTLVFVSHSGGDKLDEVAAAPEVNVAFQGGHRFVSVSGRASVDRDADRIGRLYEKSWSLWFPDGPRDPNIALIEVEPSTAEYWDGSGWNAITYAFEAAKAAARGTKIDSEAAGEHAKVKM